MKGQEDPITQDPNKRLETWKTHQKSHKHKKKKKKKKQNHFNPIQKKKMFKKLIKIMFNGQVSKNEEESQVIRIQDISKQMSAHCGNPGLNYIYNDPSIGDILLGDDGEVVD